MEKTKWNTAKRRARRILSILLVCVMCISLVPVTAYAEPAEEGEDWSAYAKEVAPDADGVYAVSDGAGLAWLAKSVNDGTLTQYRYDEEGNPDYITVRLTADIDLSAHEWIPIGMDGNHAFRAVFSGQGHTITGMRIGSVEQPYSGGYYAGLFGYLSGTVRDLKIRESAVYAQAPEGESETYAGLIAGRMINGTPAVIHCEAGGSVYTAGTTWNNKQYGAAGGIAGDNYSGTIDACRAEVTLGALNPEHYSSLGGIAGNAGINRAAVIKNCVSSMKVDGTVWADGYTLADVLAVNASDKCSMTNCTARADYAGTGLNDRSVGTKKNVCFAETNSESEAKYRYFDAEGNVSEMTAEEMKAEAFVTALNAAASGVESANAWSLNAEADGGFPVPAGAGSRTFYTVVFASVGQTLGTAVVAEGETVSAMSADPTRDGYTFLCWCVGDEDAQYDFDAPVTGSLTLNAKWEPHMYAVKFDSQGGSYVYPQNVAMDQKAAEPETPEKKGSTFGGWFTDSGCTKAWNFDTAVTGDMTLYAKWGDAPALSVSGRITDAGTGEGIRGATVSLDNGQNGATDEFGYYRIYDVEQGSYTITAEASGYNKSTQAGFAVAGASAGYDAALAPEKSGAKTANVYATVSCVYSGIMLDSVQVKAVGAGELGTYTQTTDENGFVLFTGLPTGSYTFEVNQAGRPGWESYVSKAQELSGDYNLNCALKPNYQELAVTVKGSYDPVTETEGVPLKGTKVTAVGVDPKDESRELVKLTAETDEKGTVTFDKLVPITWKISSSEFAYTETEAMVYSNGAGKLSNSAVELNLPFEESSLTVSLSSVYEDPDIFKQTKEGSPATLKVELTGTAGTLSEGITREASLNEEGKAVFGKLMPGTYQLTASGAAKRYVDVTSGDGKEIYGESWGKKFFEVDFDGRSTASVGLSQNASATLTVTPSPVSFSGTLYKTDMNADGSVTTTVLAGTKLKIKPSEYYQMKDAAEQEVTTDANGHYAVSLWPGLYGVELSDTYAAGYTGGSIVYYEGMTIEGGKDSSYRGYSCAWPSAYKWSGSNASAQAWVYGAYGLGGDVGGMNLSSGNVVADLKLVEKKVSFSFSKPFVNPGALTNLITGVEKEDKEGSGYDSFYNDNYQVHTYNTNDYHPETKGATLTVKGALQKTIDLSGQSFPQVFNDLGPGDYTFTYALDPVRFAHLTATAEDVEKKFSFFDFPAAGKLPASFPEDYAENKNPWPLQSVRDDGVIINGKEGHRKIEDLYDGDESNGELKFKFYNLNTYTRASAENAPEAPKAISSSGVKIAKATGIGPWNGVPSSKWEEYKAAFDAGADLHWRWDTGEPGDLEEAVYDDSNKPTIDQYYKLEYLSSYSSYGYGSEVYQPTACSYPADPVYPEAPDRNASKYYQHHRESYTYTDSDGKERIGWNEWDEFLTDSYNADYEAWEAECERIRQEYEDAVTAFKEAVDEATAKYNADYRTWYETEYTGKGFPKAGSLYYSPDTKEGRAHWDDTYWSMGNYVSFYSGTTTYLVGYSTELDKGKIFSSNKITALPDGKVTLYFCAPQGQGDLFLKNIDYIRNQENYKEQFKSALWFSVDVPESGLVNCDISFDPAVSSKNAVVLSQKDAENLLNPRTIKVQAVEKDHPENTLDVPVTITIGEQTFSSTVSAGYPEQTCSSNVTSATVTSDEWKYVDYSAKGVLDQQAKTETFLVSLERKQYICELTVKDDAGNPVKGADVKFTGKEYGTPFDRQTDASGKLTVGYLNGLSEVSGGLTVQGYEVSISAGGYGAQKVEIARTDFPGSLTKTVTLTRQAQPKFLEDHISMDRKGAFLPGVNFVGGTSNQIEFLTDTVLGLNGNPLYMTVEAQVDTASGDALKEVFLVDQKAFAKADYSDVPKALELPSTTGESYNPSVVLAWIEQMRSGDLGNVYYKRFSESGGFSAAGSTQGGGSHYELELSVPLWELPPDGFAACLIAVTGNDAVQVYQFDYSGEKEKEQLVGIRMEGDKAKVLNNITLLANAQAAGGSMAEKLIDMTSSTGALFPQPSFEAGVSEEEGYLTYEYKLGMKLLQGKQDVSGAKSAYLSLAPSTLGIAVSGELSMALNGEEREMTDGYNVTVEAEDLELMDYLPPMFAALPVKIEFDGNNPPSGSFTLTDTDTKDKDNHNTKKTYSFSANSQVHVNAQVSAFTSLAAVPAVGPVLLSLEKSGALDIGAQVQVAAGADGTYQYTVTDKQETEHEVSFTIGAGAGLGMYATAFGGSLGAEANVRLSGDNEKLEDMVTVTAAIDKDGFQLKEVSGKLTADAHIEIETWFINGEKDFNFGEIPFKYEFNTETQFTLTPIAVKSTMRSRNDFEGSTFHSRPETLVTGLLPIGGYATNEDGRETFLYTDMDAKGGKVCLKLAPYAGNATWNTPVILAETDGLIPAFDLITLGDGRYMAVWTEISAADMEKTCPPSVIRYSIGTVADGTWSGSVETLEELPSEVASKLCLVSDTKGVALAALRTAEGALAEKWSVSGYRFDGNTWSAATELAKNQPLYDIEACASGGTVFISYVTEDRKLHALSWGEKVAESVFETTGFETALAADETTVYLLGETEKGLMLRQFDSAWSEKGIVTDMADIDDPMLLVSGDRIIAGFTGGSGQTLYVAACDKTGKVVTKASAVAAAEAGRFDDSSISAEEGRVTFMTVLDGDTDSLKVYTSEVKADPEEPVTPETPENPENPADPVDATTQENPADSAGATTQENPADPTVATTQENPADPTVATTQENPADPTVATTQENPAEPTVATTQENPADPTVATTQENPADPAGATTQENPADPTVATTQENPADPTVATTQENPADPTVATTQENPVDPTGATTQERPTGATTEAGKQQTAATTQTTKTQAAATTEAAKTQTSVTTEAAKEEGTKLTVQAAKYEVSSKTGETPEVTYKGNTASTAKKVTIPDTVTVDGVTYEVTEIAKNALKNNKKVQTVVIGSNVEVIGEGAFKGCTALKKVSIPKSVTEIGKDALNGCKKLTTITTGKNVTKIGDRAFANCTSLKTVTISAKTKYIGNYAFKGDKNLKKIIVKSKKLTEKTVSKNAFKGVGTGVTVEVPKAKKKAYTTLFRKKGLSKKVTIK